MLWLLLKRKEIAPSSGRPRHPGHIQYLSLINAPLYPILIAIRILYIALLSVAYYIDKVMEDSLHCEKVE